MISFLRHNTVATALICVVGYFLVFARPAFFSDERFGNGRGIDTVLDAAGQFWFEVGLVVSLFLIIAVLRWWRQIALPGSYNKGTWIFLIPPLLFTTSLLVLGLLSHFSGPSEPLDSEYVRVLPVLWPCRKSLWTGL